MHAVITEVNTFTPKVVDSCDQFGGGFILKNQEYTQHLSTKTILKVVLKQLFPGRLVIKG
jgi:hypothetical protein